MRPFCETYEQGLVLSRLVAERFGLERKGGDWEPRMQISEELERKTVASKPTLPGKCGGSKKAEV